MNIYEDNLASHEIKAKESCSGSSHDDLSEVESQHSKFEGEAKPRRMPRREWRPTSNSNDFRVYIPKFQGNLDPN